MLSRLLVLALGDPDLMLISLTVKEHKIIGFDALLLLSVVVILIIVTTLDHLGLLCLLCLVCLVCSSTASSKPLSRHIRRAGHPVAAIAAVAAPDKCCSSATTARVEAVHVVAARGSCAEAAGKWSRSRAALAWVFLSVLLAAELYT